MVSSAVYRYFASRDELLTALLVDADLGNRGKAARRAPRQAPSETRDRAAALVRALGHLTGELKHWMKEAREIGVGDDAIDQIGRLTPLAREALAAARATAARAAAAPSAARPWTSATPRP